MRFAFTIIALHLITYSFAQQQLFIPDTLSGNVINLTLQTGSVNFYPGAATSTMGVNGNLLGPTIILEQNQQVTLNVNNQLGEPTTIHWHGLHVAPENDGGPHIIIPPGSTWSPSFTVMDKASTHWYHPHLHHHTNEHVIKGIAGFIISRDTEEAAINLPRTYGVDDIPLVVQTKAFDSNNQLVILSALDTSLMVNGTIKPFFDAPAQVLRFRLLNGSSERTYNFGFSGNLPFHQIAGDASLLPSAVSLTRLRLSPGERAEILINLSTLQGQTLQLMNYGTELPNAIYGASQPGMGAGQQIPNYNLNPLNGSNFTIMDIHVIAPTANPVTTIPTTLISHNPWPESSANAIRTFTFNPVNGGPTAIQGPFTINGQLFDMMVMNFETELDQIEVWELTNATPISHPFHLHGFPFYILSINGAPPPSNMLGLKDVVNVPAGQGTVRFITKFTDFTNDSVPYMYHCHMLTHEDDGMMGQFLVKNPCELMMVNQPQSQTAIEGGSISFSVNITGAGPGTNYQWQSDIGFGYQNLSNAGQYSGVNTPTLSVSGITLSNNNQLFRCIISESSNCNITSDAASLSVIINSLSKPGQVNVMKIYPNPAKNEVFVQLNRGTSPYSVFDFTGKQIQTGLFKEGLNQLTIGDLSPGIYLLRLDNNNETYRLVKH
jgi:FtsP/CotA-like multicopper oxidase with cupredoxin domain